MSSGLVSHVRVPESVEHQKGLFQSFHGLCIVRVGTTAMQYRARVETSIGTVIEFVRTGDGVEHEIEG
ncbi:unnamed protein product [Sphenostylis stenocarpa]|uniref:Uncharacterized protein n=1 Tax=Sphenostylis stenocarpa TaxID=92480 RepID=A0AA86S2E3_9FABA|nr:unnamed protein product [Sphenostylis stenocarpa]